MNKNQIYIAIAALCVVGAFVGWKMMGDNPAAANANTDVNVTADAAAAQNPAGGTTEPMGDIKLLPKNEQLAIWQQRYERAEQVYTSYKDSTRYPFDSRPISEATDQIKPFDPVSELKVMKDASGNPVKGLRLRTAQERVFVSGAETVLFTIEAFDENNKPVPLTVNQSEVRSVPEPNATAPVVQLNLPFNDSGTAGDTKASDGKYSAKLSPSTQGFSSFAGTIRLLAQVTANGEKGVAHFDIVYSPGVPATWAGVRDVIENGSLNFYLKAQIKTAGRYIVSGRVYDASGKPFAHVTFNDEVKAGTQEFKLNVFGALIRDKSPSFPLSLVDVDGYLLQADVFPDRSMMARQPGTIHTTGKYNADQFSSAEWTSEERDRYLKELGKDVDEARDEVTKLQQ